jgi:hypothetical protein
MNRDLQLPKPVHETRCRRGVSIPARCLQLISGPMLTGRFSRETATDRIDPCGWLLSSCSQRACTRAATSRPGCTLGCLSSALIYSL